jgi:hypothetical protein
MSCEGYRDKLIDALASGASVLGGELAAHLRACAECKKFHEAQAHLFGAIDSGLLAMVNETVPASLLPRVRAGLDEQGATRRARIPAWSFAAVIAAVAIVAVGGGYHWRHPERRPDSSRSGPIATQRIANPAPLAQAAGIPVTSSPNPKHRRGSPATTLSLATEPMPEVIVLAEERQAFDRFVSALPRQSNVAVALAHAAPAGPDTGAEIALLEIGDLEVKSLEATPRN